MHEGHRQRMRERFLHEGLDGFAPHEVLELLLCYAIPQRDVNPLAHELMVHFGSLHAVFEASHEELQKVDGVGPYAAALLAMIAPLGRKIAFSRQGEMPVLKNRGDVQAYCVNLLANLRQEHFYLLALNAQMRLVGVALIGKGSLSEAPAYPRQAVEAALKFNAHSVILCHNHPGGSVIPSDEDLGATGRLSQALLGIEVTVLDHLIVAGDKAGSLVQMGYIRHAEHPEDVLLTDRE